MLKISIGGSENIIHAMDMSPSNTVIRSGLVYYESRVKLGASLGSSQMIQRLATFQLYYERYNFMGNFYLVKTHLVSIFKDAGSEICFNAVYCPSYTTM